MAFGGFFLALGLDPPGGVFLLGVPGGVVGIGLGSIDLLPFPSLSCPFTFTLTDWFWKFLWTVLS